MSAPDDTVVAETAAGERSAGVRMGEGVPEPRRSVAPLLLRLHFYAGILIAPFLVVAALTGLMFTVTPQLDSIVYDRELHTGGGGPRTPVSDQVAAAVAAHPDGSVTSVILPDGDEINTRVVFAVGAGQETVYVDPYTAQVRGSLPTVFGSTPLQMWFDVLHRDLHLGAVGEHYSELAASWLWVVALGGVVLWLRRQRGRRRVVRGTLLPDLAARTGVRRTRGWHGAVGVWLALGLLLLSATGLTWSRYAGATFSDALDAMDGRAPVVSTGTGAGTGGDHHGGGSGEAAPVDVTVIDTVVSTARGAGLDGTIVVSPSGGAWTVIQDDNVWPVAYDSIAVDPDGTTVTDRVDFSDWPLLAKLSKLGIMAHMGTLFGVVNQVMLAALAVGLLCVIGWGYRMWWQRRPTRLDRVRRLGAPPARGAWQRLPAWAIAVGVPLVVAVGWALPMLGVPLLAFLAVDLAVGALQQRRAARIAPVSPVPVDTREAASRR